MADRPSRDDLIATLRPLLLPGVPVERVADAYADAPGNEIGSGKFSSAMSSAALAANAFGWFLERADRLPALPGTDALGWPARSVRLEAILRFPWPGGRHPCLDALIETDDALIGVESKRYEPWRGHMAPMLSDTYWRPRWGARMAGYQRVRDGLKDGTLWFRHLDAAQLVKHALALRTEVERTGGVRRAVLAYVYAEPGDVKSGPEMIARHRAEIARFLEAVGDDEVAFVAVSYGDLLVRWQADGEGDLHAHVTRLRAWARFVTP
jgi:hypothetical protein